MTRILNTVIIKKYIIKIRTVNLFITAQDNKFMTCLNKLFEVLKYFRYQSTCESRVGEKARANSLAIDFTRVIFE